MLGEFLSPNVQEMNGSKKQLLHAFISARATSPAGVA